MDAPISELKQLEAHKEQARTLMGQGRHADALAAVEQALAIEAKHLAALKLKAEILAQMGATAEAEQALALYKACKHEAWEREVEAEIRGHHDVLGEAIRHEKL